MQSNSRAVCLRSGRRRREADPARQAPALGARSGRAMLIDAGVTSFKIEGRLKDEGYIRNVVAYYRRRLDEAIVRCGDCRRASVGRRGSISPPDPAKSFTRAESEYFLMGRSAGVASFDTPKSVRVRSVAACDVRGFCSTATPRSRCGRRYSASVPTARTSIPVEGRRIAPNRMPASIRPGAGLSSGQPVPPAN